MIAGIGVDIEEISYFRHASRSFLGLVFTEREIAYCLKRKPSHVHLAGKFCAKEAFLKASGKKLPLGRIEIVNLPSGSLAVYVNGLRQSKVHCSISHTAKNAVALAVIEK